MLRIIGLLGLAFVILFGLVPVDLSSASAADDAAPKSKEIGHGAKKEAHKSETHHEEIGESGVNTDPSIINPELSVYTFVVFLVLLAVLWRFAWGPISKGLEKRESGIRQNIAAAEEARLKAEQMLAEHAARLDKVQDEVREIVAEVRRDAEHVKREIVSERKRKPRQPKSGPSRKLSAPR